MKAVLTDARFSDPDWIFERKLDGIRCIAIRVRASACGCCRATTSRSTRATRSSSTALEAEACDRFAIDGEVVAFDGAQTSFARLAERGHRDVPVFFYVFDIVWLDGQDVRALPLRARKRLLRDALAFHDGVRLTPYRNEAGEALFAEACRKGWEGVIAKRADSPYRATRSQRLAEVQVRAGPGARDRRLHGAEGLAHRVRRAAARLLRRRRAPLRRQGRHRLRPRDAARPRRAGCARSPATTRRSPTPTQIRERGITWVEPELVAQVGVHRVDPRRPPAPPALPRAARRQGRAARSSARAERAGQAAGARTARAAHAVANARITGCARVPSPASSGWNSVPRKNGWSGELERPGRRPRRRGR